VIHFVVASGRYIESRQGTKPRNIHYKRSRRRSSPCRNVNISQKKSSKEELREIKDVNDANIFQRRLQCARRRNQAHDQRTPGAKPFYRKNEGY